MSLFWLKQDFLKESLKLSEVLAEREQQILRKKEKEGIQKKIDARFLAMEQEVCQDVYKNKTDSID